MTEVSEKMLSAYLDGELAPAEAARLAARIAANAELALRVARHRRLDELLREAAPETPTPDDDPLVERILSAAQPRRPTASARKPAWTPQGALVAAALGAVAMLLGVAVGRFAPHGDLQMASTGLVAKGALARALEHQPSGVDASGGAVRVALTLRAGDGRFCRQFVLKDAVQGLACRQADGWRVLATAEQPKAAGGYRPAGGEDGPVDRAIQALGAQMLDPTDEARALRRGWR